MGNRKNVTGGPDTGPWVGSYIMDPTLPEPGDFQMNQYTTTGSDSRRYDKNGNLAIKDDGEPGFQNIKYDYRDRMVEYTDGATGQRHTYSYDPLGRRIAKVIDANGVAGGSTEIRYLYDDRQVVEEQTSTGATAAIYVYGPYLDEVITMQRGGTNYFYHHDNQFNIMAITNGTDAVVERYDYADYGEPLDTDTLNPLPGNPSTIGNHYLFTGRRFDTETAWYYYRTRYLDPIAGRFTVRDTTGIWADNANLGNGYTLVNNNPWSYLDPMGLAKSLVTLNVEVNVIFSAVKTEISCTVLSSPSAMKTYIEGCRDKCWSDKCQDYSHHFEKTGNKCFSVCECQKCAKRKKKNEGGISDPSGISELKTVSL